jgi:hypothetical protein
MIQAVTLALAVIFFTIGVFDVFGKLEEKGGRHEGS